MPTFKGLSKFFGNTASTAAGFAAGVATAPALVPALQAIENEAWSLHPDKPPDAVTLAEGVSQGQVAKAQAYKWAAETGYSAGAMDALVSIANVGPGMAQAFNLWRRSQIDKPGFYRALQRIGLEAEWIDDLWAVRMDVLDTADLARGIHKGLINDPGLLATPAPSGTGKVPAYPVYPIDALEEAHAAGYDKDHLGVLVGLQGNPMGAHEAAQAEFRGIIEPVDYDRAIAEGNTRNEWGNAIREQSRQIPTAHEFFENALRGYTSLQDALAGAAKHGMSEADAMLIYQNQGRPMNVHQITTGLARGGKFKPEPGELTDPYMASIVEGSLKPAYYDLALANRYTLPGYFVIKAMLGDGTLSEQEAATIFEQEGWPPELATKAAAALAKQPAAKRSSWVTKAQGYVFTLLHKSYVDTPLFDAKAREGMTLLGIPAPDQQTILELFKFEATIGPAANPAAPTTAT